MPPAPFVLLLVVYDRAPCMESTKIQPIDNFVFIGFQQRFQQVFDCNQCLFTNEHEKTKILQRIFGEGEPLEYPYAYFSLTSISANTESYNAHSMMRRGIVINVNNENTVQTVRVIPTNFELELHYVTNKFESIDQGSVRAFARRWLLARRAGYLKFNIKYGRLSLGVNLTLPDSISIPSRDNIVEGTTDYDVSVNLTIHGYTSEPILGTYGKTNKINANTSIGGTFDSTTKTNVPIIVSQQTFEFPPRT